VETFNGVVRSDLMGRKAYQLTRNQPWEFESALPSDGVVYVPALGTSTNFPEPFLAVHSFVKPFAGTDTNTFVLASELHKHRLSGRTLQIMYRDHGGTITADSDVFSENYMTKAFISINDFHDSTTISPLLYEGYHIPAGVLDAADLFVVTHVRGDKRRQDVSINLTQNLDQLSTGRLAYTVFHVPRPGESAVDVVAQVAFSFFRGLSSSRVIKLLPAHVGVSENFMEAFMADWRNGTHLLKYSSLSKLLNGTVYSGPVDALYDTVKREMPYMSALYFIDVLFRYPFVKRNINQVRGKVFVAVEFDITRDYKWKSLPYSTDLLGFPTVKQ